MSVFVGVLAGFLAKIAVDRWKIWNNRIKNPTLGEKAERLEQNNLAWDAIWLSAVSLILFLLTFTIPPDLVLTIISN